ncbi:hypothetical protein AVEN_261590-1 [Araneus ventricosus]|uniref:Uncharacterized protein n=1 Tax=Araneus ventricosus TaxID=182803 RepID=A0A4Y2E8N9_ARAVE|nr:hypothetical protein AVEN_261590-1 [Araneus ventricosus]
MEEYKKLHAKDKEDKSRVMKKTERERIVRTTGLKPFHSMSGMKCITPPRALPPVDRTKRLKSVSSAEEASKLSALRLLT